MSKNQNRTGVAMGFLVQVPTAGMTTQALSALGTWLTLGLATDKARTLAKVRVYASAVTGTLGGPDLTCDLCSDSAGNPGAVLQTSSTVATTPTGPAWVEFTGFSQALEAGAQYWLVLKNANPAPAANFPTYRTTSGNMVPPWSNSGSTLYGWTRKVSTNSGASWTSPVTSIAGYRLEFTDGTFDGLPVQDVTVVPSAADRVYGTREIGVRFTADPGSRLNVRGVAFYTTSGGAPTGDLRLRLYSGAAPTLIDTSIVVPKGNFVAGSNQWITAYLPTTRLITGGTVIRAVISETSNADTSTNFYGLPTPFRIEDDANSKALTPFGGTLQKTYFDGTNWTETDTMIYPFALLLDTDAPFAAVVATGGSGISRSRIMGGC